ncbi:MAG: hypothetical protein U0U69_13410 [Acidimicrobiia bacterium]
MLRQLVAVVLAGVALAACNVRPNMTPGGPGGFFATPWPNDVRTRADGTIDLGGFPGRWNGIVNSVMQKGEVATRGFGPNASAYFTFDGPLDTSSLPTPTGSLADDSPVVLVNVDPDSPRRGDRTPVQVDFRAAPSFYRPANLLSVMPYPGFPLDDATTYAVVLRRGLRNTSGAAVSRAAYLSRIDHPWSADAGYPQDVFERLQEQWQAVKELVDPGDVLAFTAYTTQTITPTMEAIQAASEELPLPSPRDVHVVADCSYGGGRVTLDGVADLPRWQAGKSPYLDTGGNVVVVDAKAVKQADETVHFRAVFPCGTPPPGGWPVVTHIDGTGANYDRASDFVDTYFAPPAQLDVAVFSIAPVFSGDRADPGLAELSRRLAALGVNLAGFDLTELAFYNFFNPVAGRDNQLQQAADASFLRRLASVFTATVDSGGGVPVTLTTDPGRVMYSGHSQGSTSVAPALAVDPGFSAAFLSSAGAGLYHAIIHRGDIRPLVDALLFTNRTELSEAHPIVQVLQTLAEGGDSANYASAILTPNVLMTNGMDDGCQPREAAFHLATAAGFDVATPVLKPVPGIEDLLGRAPLDRPISGNLGDGRTGAIVEIEGGHFVSRTNPELVRGWVDSWAATGHAVVDAGTLVPNPLKGGCPYRFDP